MKLRRSSICTTLLAVLLSTSISADCSYELFSISSTKDTRIIDFIEQLSDECEFSVIVTDSHAEKFLEKKLNKTHLKNLTIDEVLDVILKENNLSYKLENNILKLSYLSTKVFGIDYILSQRKGSGSTDITLSSSSDAQGATGAGASVGTSSGAAGSTSNAQSGITITSEDEVKFWTDLDLELRRVLNRPNDIYEAEAPIINKNAGLITVTATTKQMARLESYLERLQKKVQLQVLIDVQLLSVTMQKGKTTGIDWQQLYALQDITIKASYGKGTITDGAGTSYDPTGFVTVEGGGTLKEVIKFLQTQGNVNSISNPKVLTLNNQPALITAGTEYFYKIQESTNQQGTGGGVAATTQNDEVKSVFAGVLLDITPEIADDKTITLKINPSLSETTETISTNSANRIMPPDLNRRQLSSVVTVKDGNRIILGGLINTSHSQVMHKVPILGDIPGLSYLFKWENKVRNVQELVIIIEPHIIGKENNELSLSDLGYEGLKDKLLDSIKSTNSEKEEDEI
ncbi:MAG: pilus (MSHA type) biogenesis protein MshL [Helicobacteraceae bacterium CG2_30_36_10]|nr:MAG: pilus (MSHA type) biogenesis protein MshL [Helicobacteraceae bacterium CG2_30_36_10]